MFFWIFVIALVLVVAFLFLAKWCSKKTEREKEKLYDVNDFDERQKRREMLTKRWYYKIDDIWDTIDIALIVTTVVLAVIVGIMLIILLVNYGTADGFVVANEQRYESLVYQLENDVYENDNDLGKKELYDSIQEWNEDLAVGKTYERSFWWGIFYPNVYEQFDFIELK